MASRRIGQPLDLRAGGEDPGCAALRRAQYDEMERARSGCRNDGEGIVVGGDRWIVARRCSLGRSLHGLLAFDWAGGLSIQFRDFGFQRSNRCDSGHISFPTGRRASRSGGCLWGTVEGFAGGWRTVGG